MFPDSLTFCVDAVYAAEACSGVPSILDDCYYRAIFCWLLNFPLFRGDGPAPWSKNLCIWIFTLKTDPFSLMVCTPKDWASFHPCTAEGWNYSIPSADEEQTKWRERKSIYACTLLGLHGWVCVRVCAKYFLLFPRSRALVLSLLRYKALFGSRLKCNPKKRIGQNRWSEKCISIQPPSC